MKKGFTLIELLIVVAIIAILAAIAVPNFLEAQTRAKVARVVSDMRTIATGLETYRIDNGYYTRYGIWVNGVGANGQLTYGPQYIRHVLDPVTVTTPIAYISSEAVTFDTFQVHLRKNVPKTDFNNWLLGRMVYVSSDKPVSGDHYADPSIQANERERWGSYRLTSAGPDQAYYNSKIPPEGTVTSRLISPKFRVYDASNGTVSAGDIWRLTKSDEFITRLYSQTD